MANFRRTSKRLQLQVQELNTRAVPAVLADPSESSESDIAQIAIEDTPVDIEATGEYDPSIAESGIPEGGEWFTPRGAVDGELFYPTDIAAMCFRGEGGIETASDDIPLIEDESLMFASGIADFTSDGSETTELNLEDVIDVPVNPDDQIFWSTEIIEDGIHVTPACDLQPITNDLTEDDIIFQTFGGDVLEDVPLITDNDVIFQTFGGVSPEDTPVTISDEELAYTDFVPLTEELPVMVQNEIVEINTPETPLVAIPLSDDSDIVLLSANFLNAPTAPEESAEVDFTGCHQAFNLPDLKTVATAQEAESPSLTLDADSINFLFSSSFGKKK